MATAVNVSATYNAEIDGMLSGSKWSGTITYSFPDLASDYPTYTYGNNEPASFTQAPAAMQSAINYAVGLIKSYTNITLNYAGTNGADIMIGQSSAANPTSYAYYPGNYVPGGDIWFGTSYPYAQAALGNYYFATAMHELGHALGLKHSQEVGGPGNVAVPTAHDDSEYTIMSYRSYVGAPLTGYTAETYGFSQTYMANDILALQTMYGANYATQSANTVYTWSTTTGQEFINGVAQPADGGGAGGSANRIFETIWDGGGVDTYDLSNYTTNLSINLNPGAASVFSSTQLAYLGNGHYASGNIYNAYLYNSDARSYIDNATGGAGNDSIIGNMIANILNGGSGNDTIMGGGGNDTINGGAGTDIAVYSGSRANYGISYNSTTQIFTFVDQRSGTPDGTDTLSGMENFQFADGTISSATLIGQLVPVVIEAIGDTALVQSGNNYLLSPVIGGTGPLLKISGAPIVTGQFSGFLPVAAEVAGGGYRVAFKDVASGQFSVWSVDLNGNYLNNIVGIAAGSSTAVMAQEPSFHQDLNGDGSIGYQMISTIVESLGSTSLAQIGANYYLNPTAGGSGPDLKINGSPVYAGQFGGYLPVAAETMGSGYEVAFKDAGSGQFSVWSVDANGNYLSNIVGIAAGNSAIITSLEYSFQQDLNSDGTIVAPLTSTIESYGSTSLVQIDTHYYFNGNAGSELKINGSPVYAGQYGSYLPVAAEATNSGYKVAFKDASSGQFSIWSVNSSGDYISNIVGVAPGSSTAIMSQEPSFHQDLNGDGVIGNQLVSTTIESYGSISLVQIGANYHFYPVNGGVGLQLTINGAPVYAGQYGGYLPVAAEATASGYEVAFKDAASGQFSVWNVDSNGAYISNVVGIAAGNSAAVTSLEPSFHQDLNGDGSIGAPSSSALELHFLNAVSVVEQPNLAHFLSSEFWI